MTYFDCNSASEQTSFDLIPKGTLVRVRMTNKPVGFDEASQGWTGGYATHPTDLPWVEALQASVRPVITYAFFLVFAVVKVSALLTMLQSDSMTLTAALQAAGDEETQALFAAVMSFWFGSPQISKMCRGGGADASRHRRWVESDQTA